jgi:hypothetical protein
MKTCKIVSSVTLVGAMALAGAAVAEQPYPAWSKVDDHSVNGSYNTDVTKSETYSSESWYRYDPRTSYQSSVEKTSQDSFKVQNQDAGHKGFSSADGYASGHQVDTTGSTNSLNVGNDQSSAFLSPSFVNNNVPVTTIVGGDSNGPIVTTTKVAGRDMDVNRGLIGSPVGNTSAFVQGAVSQASSSALTQSGDSSNRVHDPMIIK